MATFASCLCNLKTRIWAHLIWTSAADVVLGLELSQCSRSTSHVRKKQVPLVILVVSKGGPKGPYCSLLPSLCTMSVDYTTLKRPRHPHATPRHRLPSSTTDTQANLLHGKVLA
ncbi:hypothetical protein CC1G_14078 [Coprinopsis cinerea okayama7|uniref:Secreted protein n=1 Tax=Coprinopsis cinerea (strain Okayama-7 / 130 / ATCC MYA-4618 / FGSC 9003) TaxID=240176 RepID=D6RL51_COPC7|nr:hypothetical protein CC1G_14078 [Coprinopsis cinerea okayama7\|eukprot:XP_002911546.1 hypothetical protein CC1G_14078 [Coprinopsis cinerea okayama7\